MIERPRGTSRSAGRFRAASSRFEEDARAVTYAYAFAFAAGFEWSIFLPTLPLLIVNEMAKPVPTVGYVLSLFATASLASFLVQRYSKTWRISQHSLLRCILALRVLAALLHISACRHLQDSRSPESRQFALELTFGSRGLHGLTSSSFAIMLAWVGAAQPQHKRPEAIALLNGASVLGTLVGPMVGISLAGALGSGLAGSGLAGWLVLISSASQVGIAHVVAPAALVPSHSGPSPIGAAGRDSLSEEEWRYAMLVGGSAFMVFCGWISLEATIGVVAMATYGWTAANQAPLWLGMSVSGLVATLLFVDLRKRWHPLKLAVLLQAFIGVGASLTINWGSWQRGAVSWPQMLAGVVMMGVGCNLSLNLHNMLLDAHIGPQRLERLMTFVQICAQLGRCVGPVVATQVFGFGVAFEPYRIDSSGAHHFAANLTMLVQGALCFLGAALPVWVGTAMYDVRFEDEEVPRQWSREDTHADHQVGLIGQISEQDESDDAAVASAPTQESDSTTEAGTHE